MSPLLKSRGLAAAIAAISFALLLPAQAQFWDWGGRPQRPPQQGGGWGGGWGGGGGFFDLRPPQQQQQAPVDYSRAPPPAQKKPEANTPIVVLGDANADWLAYGLEDAFSDKPEINIVRKHRTDSGLIRYDGRRDSEWAQIAREVIAAEKPKFIVMMIGNNDRQQIRERAPPVARPGAPKAATSTAPTPPLGAAVAPAAPAPAAAPDPEQQTPEPGEAPEQLPANLTPEQARQAMLGPWEFHTERWEIAYIRRIDATIAAMKSAGVPVIWVGLPSQRGPKSSADSAYLNEIYRSRAEKAGITYVDIWDGFVDEAGRFSPQGPDYEGQIRRLRTADGVFFTKFGARKLAHYVERELQRFIQNRGLPVALPIPDTTPVSPKSGGPAQRPVAGPVVPLTAAKVVQEELIGGGRAPAARAPAGDATATRVLTKGEPIPAPSGRADDFSWPRGSGANVSTEPAVADPAVLTPPTAAAVSSDPKPPANKPAATTAQRATDAQGAASAGGAVPGATNPAGEPKAIQRRPKPNPDAPRPPMPLQGLFRF
jgi:hypothetical protein